MLAVDLDKNKLLYTILGFFAAADMIDNHRIRISRADTLSDQNGGIEKLLFQLEASGPAQSCGSMG
jgi:hypothetical protein